MKKNFWSGRMKTILIAALVVAILAAVVLGLSSGASFFENVTGSILSPVRSAVAAIDRQFERYYNYLFQYAKLESENTALQSQVLSMEEDIRTVEELQRENERYKALLQLSESHEDYSYVASYITSWDASDYKSAFTIGKGTNYGLEEGMCADHRKRAGRGPDHGGRLQLGDCDDDHGLVSGDQRVDRVVGL